MPTLDTLKELLNYLISLLEPSARLLYSLAYKKALFFGYSDLAFGILFFMLSLILLFLGVKDKIKNWQYETIGLSIFIFVISMILFYQSAFWFVNTELQAIKLIVEMMPK